MYLRKLTMLSFTFPHNGTLNYVSRFSSLMLSVDSHFLVGSFNVKPKNVKYCTVNYKKFNDFTDLIQESDKVTSSDWVMLQDDAIKSCRGITKLNIDAIIIQDCIRRKNFKLALNYVNYLKEIGGNLNLGAAGMVMILYDQIGKTNGLTEEEKRSIISLYKDICSKHSVLDPLTSESCIQALSFTSKWRESLRLLDNIAVVQRPSNATYSAIVCAALKNDDSELAWSFLNELASENRNPLDVVYLEYIEYSIKKYGNSKQALLQSLEKILCYCGNNNCTIGIDTANRFHEVFTNFLNWKGAHILINESGNCSHCKKNLQIIKLSSENYEQLRNTFYDKVLIGNNIFMKSTPQELKSYMQFVRDTAPFDIVVDGLNVAFSVANSKSVQVKSNLLVLVIKKLLKDYKKILVLGRKHMNGWPAQNINFIKKNCSVFFTDDLSYDDPFMLYAALSSPKTLILSRDLMRSHKYLLKDDSIRTIFKRWQQTHHLSLIYASNSYMSVKKPHKYLPTAQKNIGWHIPYNHKNNMIAEDTLDLPKNWLCLQPPVKSGINPESYHLAP